MSADLELRGLAADYVDDHYFPGTEREHGWCSARLLREEGCSACERRWSNLWALDAGEHVDDARRSERIGARRYHAWDLVDAAKYRTMAETQWAQAVECLLRWARPETP